MKKNICLLVLAFFIAVVLTFVSMPSHAQDVEYAEKNTLLRTFEEKGGIVDYLGRSHGLDGWIIRGPEGSAQYVYTNKEGATLIGMLFSSDAKMVTKTQVQAYVARLNGSQAAMQGEDISNLSNAEKVYADIEMRSNWIQLGKKEAPYIYTFVNPHCDHCHDFLNKVMPHIKSGKLSVRLIPYGSQPENKLGAQILLSEEKPLDAIMSLLKGENKLGEDQKGKIKADAETNVLLNNFFAQELVPKAPPFTIYRKVTDGTLSVISGIPKNLISLLVDLEKTEDQIAVKKEKTEKKKEGKKK